MIIVAHRVGVGEPFQIGRIAGLHVEKLHRRQAFSVWSSKPVGCPAPLDPMPTLTSTHGEEIVAATHGLAGVAAAAEQSSCCHIWNRRWTGLCALGVVSHVRQICRLGQLKYGPDGKLVAPVTIIEDARVRALPIPTVPPVSKY